MKIILYLTLISFICLTINSCSSDNDELYDNYGISVSYRTIDADGKTATVFKNGETMTFDLVIRNLTDHTLKYADESDFIKGAFLVYNSVGQSFNPVLATDFRMHPVVIEAGEQFCRRLSWPWSTVPLPVGQYYSSCTLVAEENKKQTYTTFFEIK